MDNGQKTMKISTRLFIVSGILLVLTYAVIVALVNYRMKQQALVEAEAKIKVMANQYFAIHTYFSQKLKPALFEFTKPIRSDEYFDPTWMSSTYAIREIIKYTRLSGGDEYYLKDAAINARSPENEASPLEKDFISALNTDPKLKNRSGVEVIDGKPYLVLQRRGESMEASCLRCHSSPEQAPIDLIRYYGAERSFNRKIGDWVHAVSIRVPLSSTYTNANRFSLKLSGFLLTTLLVFFGVLYWLNNRLVFKPLSMLHEKALEISSSEKLLGEEIPLPSGKELKELTLAFNKMSISLRYHMDHLEALVKDRTDEIFKTNEQLKLEISERKQSEETLCESETRYHELFDNISSGVAIYEVRDNGNDFIFKDFNKAGERLDGDHRESLIGKSIYEARPGIEEFGLLDVFRRVWKTGVPEHFPAKKYQDERLQKWYENFVYRLPLGEIVVVFDDITERKQAEEAQREKEEKYKSLVESTDDSIYLVGKDLTYLFMNQSHLSRYGGKEEEVIGRSYAEFHSEKETRDFANRVQAVLDTGRSLSYEYQSKKDGGHYLRSLNPVKDSNGETKAVTVISRNFTARRKAEEALRQTNEALSRAHNQRKILSKRLIDLLEKDRRQIAMELHDHIGQTLTSIKMDIEMIHGKLKPEQRELEARITAAQERTIQAIKDVKNISRGLRPAMIDTLGVVSSLRELFNEIQRQTDIDIKFFSRNIPKRFTPEKELAIYRIAQEAMTNIIRHAKAKNVFVNLVKKDEDLSLSVEDDGVGFDQDKVMTFSKNKGPLGLLIMRERAVQLDGEFTIESQIGKGTHLLMEIPI